MLHKPINKEVKKLIQKHKRQFEFSDYDVGKTFLQITVNEPKTVAWEIVMIPTRNTRLTLLGPAQADEVLSVLTVLSFTLT